MTRSCLYYAVRVATDPTIPANGGCYRPLTLVAPSGSVVNADPPAAVAAGNVETSQRIADVLLGALAQAAPDRVPAASQGTMNNILVGNDDFAYYETVGGGQGGRPGRAGQSGIHTGMTNTENTPIEALDTHYPVRVDRYTLRRGSGGQGRFPGGEGIEREILFLADATLSLMGERRRHRPWGLAGGGPGASAKTGSSNRAAVVSVFPPNAPFPCKPATGSSCSPREAGDGGNPEAPCHNYPHPVSLVGDLRGVLSDDRVLEEPVELYLYSRDASLMHGQATCVVFPHTTRGSGRGGLGGRETRGPDRRPRRGNRSRSRALYPSTGESSCPPPR